MEHLAGETYFTRRKVGKSVCAIRERCPGRVSKKSEAKRVERENMSETAERAHNFDLMEVDRGVRLSLTYTHD